MRSESRQCSTLSQFVERLHRRSIYIFSLSEVEEHLSLSRPALNQALFRLTKKQKIIRLSNGIYLIIPPEYADVGAPPPPWYIDELMKRKNTEYYVGLLSAAACYGATHQQPQEYQVMTEAQIRMMSIAKSRIRFIRKNNIAAESYQKINTPTGVMNISTPEVTAIDLVAHPHYAGYLSNVATVLLELSEKLNPETLVFASQMGVRLSVIQRLGYLLEHFVSQDLSRPLFEFLQSCNVEYVPLQVGQSTLGCQKDKKWHILINEEVEVDDV